MFSPQILVYFLISPNFIFVVNLILLAFVVCGTLYVNKKAI